MSVWQPSPIVPDARVYVAGHNGLAGSAIWRALVARGHADLVGLSSAELDLRERSDVFDFFAASKPRHVILAAARVGGILANSRYPVDFLGDNLRIQANVMDAALRFGVERLLFLGSSCIYPRDAPQPIVEDALLTGPLEPTNSAYAIAKIAGIANVQAVRRQYGRPWISAMPTNLYGPGDNFSSENSHVLPALIRRYDEAVRDGLTRVTNWGTGTPRREFLHADDMASACLYLLDHFDGSQQVNVGAGADITIRGLAELVAELIHYRGSTDWDASRPDGTPQKLLDGTTLRELGWAPSVSLRQGLTDTIAWYQANRDMARNAKDKHDSAGASGVQR